MEDILGEARKVAEEAEVFYVSSQETTVQFESNRLKHMQSKQTNTLAVRLIKNGRVGYATGNQIAGGKELVRSAVETAQFGAPAQFHFPDGAAYPETSIVDESVRSVSTEGMIKLGEQMVSAITGRAPGILCEASVEKGEVTLRIVNSRGGRGEYRKTFFGIGVEGTLINGTDMLFVGDSEMSCHPLNDVKPVTDEVIRQLDWAKELAPVATGTMPVIFTPDGVGAALAMPLMAAFNGKTVLEGASPVGKKRGQQVFDPRFSLWDDPLVPYRPGSRPCDDEGVPSQRTPLVENGKVAGFLYDLQTAGRAGTRSTGNGARGRGGLPAPSPSTLVIAPGQDDFKDMIADMKEGLIIEQLIGAEMGNILGGDFSGNVLLGYKVEKGRVIGRVKNTMVSGNVYQLLKQMAGLGRETRWVGGYLQAPHVYCPALSVAAKES